MSRRGFGRRKTVLQLQDPKQDTFGFGYKHAGDVIKEGAGGIGALASYEGSEEEEEEEEEIQNAGNSIMPMKFVASSERLEPNNVPTPSEVAHKAPGKAPGKAPSKASVEASKTSKASSKVAFTMANGRSTSPAPIKPSKPKDEIDFKVMDFMAELETIESGDTTGGDGLDGAPLATSDSSYTDESTDDDDDPQPKPPPEPDTEWQQCLDEGTECYYYWHYVTNEVVWEIPSEYSQYLLQYKEYEEKEAKFAKNTADWEKRKASQPKKPKKKRKKKVKAPLSLVPYADVPEPILSSPTTQSNTSSEKSSELVVQGPELPPLPPEPAPIGPQLPEPPAETSTLIGPQLPPAPPPPDEIPSLIGPELPSSSPLSEKNPAIEKEKPDEDSDVDIDELLEAPVFTKYEYVNKKYEEPKVESIPSQSMDDQSNDELELDIDDIDAELEKALERKKVELHSKDSDSNQMKRKAPSEEPIGKHKKHRMDDVAPAKISRVHRADIKRKVSSLAEVTELSSLITDKLDFLEITAVQGLSKLQILMIQVETRTEDWKSGGLTTEHFLCKLQEANEQLEDYEASAAPPGWSCHWDSKFKRYFYHNGVTDETQWDYPDVDETTQPIDPSTSTSLQPPLPPTIPPHVMTQPSDVSYVHNHPLYDAPLFPPPPPPPPPPVEDCESPVSGLVAYPDTPETMEPPIRTYGPPPPPPPIDDDIGPPMPPHMESQPMVEPALPVPDEPMVESQSILESESMMIGPQMPQPMITDQPMVVEQMEYTPTESSRPENEPECLTSIETKSSPVECEDVYAGPSLLYMPNMESLDGEPLPPGESPENVVNDKPKYAAVPPPIISHNMDDDINGVELNPDQNVVSSNNDNSEEMDINQVHIMEPDSVVSHGIEHDSLIGNQDIRSPSVSSLPSDPGNAIYGSSPVPTPMSSQQEPETSGSVLTASTVTSTSSTPAVPPVKEKKKKKKDKSLVGGGFYMKKKNVSGLVQKWQKVQKDVNSEISKEQIRTRQIEEELAALNS